MFAELQLTWLQLAKHSIITDRNVDGLCCIYQIVLLVYCVWSKSVKYYPEIDALNISRGVCLHQAVN